QLTIDDDQMRKAIGKVCGEENREAAAEGMPHDRRAVPAEMRRDVDDVTQHGIERVILIRAPAGIAESAAIEGDNLALVGEPFGDADPVIGIEIIAAMKNQQGRRAGGLRRQTEGAIEQVNVPGGNRSRAMRWFRNDLSPAVALGRKASGIILRLGTQAKTKAGDQVTGGMAPPARNRHAPA
ncbi:MAG: hypothetical protein R3229_18220, partial [Alphaproteobacteria bacterium]|nr:hypothetical protein [Alphaproteobacteria bacterium]